MVNTKIEINAVMELYTIFSEKEWFNLPTHKSSFESLNELAGLLKQNQFALLLELLKRYTWFGAKDYEKCLCEMLEELGDRMLRGKIDTVHLFPIVKPKDAGETKSGNAVIYQLTGLFPCVPQVRSATVKQKNCFSELHSSTFSPKKNEVIIFVDDFIGTGKTLRTTLTEAFKNNSITKSNSVIFSMMMQQNTYQTLVSEGYIIICPNKIDRGISDHYTGIELKNKIDLMTEIENNIQHVNSYRFGYEKSEALVTTIRTPNNTFPIFWKSFNKNGKKFTAPFPRY